MVEFNVRGGSVTGLRRHRWRALTKTRSLEQGYERGQAEQDNC